MAFGMRLTDIGAAKLLQAAVDETAITFDKVLWGNANGVSYTPTGAETALVNELHETDIVSVDIDPEMPNVYRVVGALASAAEEFTLLEVGIVDEDGDLIAIGNHPAQVVPGPDSGFTLNYSPTWLLVISPDLAVAVTLQPQDDFATEEWVTANFQPIGDYVETVTGSAGVIVEGSATDRDARADEAWFNTRYRRKDDPDPGVQGISVTTGVTKTGPNDSPTIGFDVPWGDNRYRLDNEPFPLQPHVHATATQSENGFMSSADKTKLDGLGSAGGTGLFTKVSEVLVTTTRDYIDLLNVTGGDAYLLLARGVRVSGSVGSNAITLGLQTGPNAGPNASNGDYDDPALPYLKLAPYSGGTEWLDFGDLDNSPVVTGNFAMLIRDLNHASRRTARPVRSGATDFGTFFGIDPNTSSGSSVVPFRSVAQAENRIRLLVPGRQFTAGKVSVYAFDK